MLYTPNISVITKEIEGADDGQTADQAAQALWRGLERGDAYISGDLLTNIFRARTRGAAPKNNWIVDAFLDWVSFVSLFHFGVREFETSDV